MTPLMILRQIPTMNGRLAISSSLRTSFCAGNRNLMFRAFQLKRYLESLLHSLLPY